jgi:uncharacterized protein YdeI (BOF family)
MTKTLIWSVVAVLAVAGLGALAYMEFGPREAPVADAASDAVSTAATVAKGGPDPAAAPPAVPSAAPASSAPAAVAATAAPTVDALLGNAAAYDGARVSLVGVILTQCTAGCEFALSDDTGVISVTLEGKAKDRLLPLGKVGKKIAVQGVFRASPRPQIVVDDPNGWQLVK